MSINKETKNGITTWAVYVSAKSKAMPHIRFQKRIKGLKSQAEAARKEKSLLKELSVKVAQREGHGFTWRMVIEKWYSCMSSDSRTYQKYSSAVVKDYYGLMHKWTKKWLDRHASDLNRGDGREALDSILSAGRSKSHQKKLKNTINMIYNWGIEERLINNVNNSPVHGLQIMVNEDKRPEILRVSEIRNLLYQAKVQQHDWYAIWAFALLTGMRSGELYALKWSDIDLDNRTIVVQRSYDRRTDLFKSTKAGYWRTVPISNELAQIIDEQKNLKSGAFVLPRLNEWKRGAQAKVLRFFCDSINIESVKFHTLRACFATQLLGDGAEPMKVMKICGWRDLKTMARYVRLAGIDEKGVTDNLNFLPPEASDLNNVVNLFNDRN